MNENNETSSAIKNWNKIIRKIWDDPTQKQALIENPRTVLKENGIDVPEKIAIHIHENTDEVVHFVLPKKPPKELSDDFLSHIVAGFHYAEETIFPKNLNS